MCFLLLSLEKKPETDNVGLEPDQSPTLLMQQGIPVGRPAHVELRNQHAQYAAIWCVSFL